MAHGFHPSTAYWDAEQSQLVLLGEAFSSHDNMHDVTILLYLGTRGFRFKQEYEQILNVLSSFLGITLNPSKVGRGD